MGSRSPTHTGVCPGCGARRTINVVGQVIRLHDVDTGRTTRAECPGSLRPPAAGTVKLRSEAPPTPPPQGYLSLAERRCREFPCKVCHAKPGEGCVTLVKRYPAHLHVNRHAQATAAGRLPLTDAELDADRSEHP